MSLLEILTVPEDHTLEENYVVLMESHLDYLLKSKNTTALEISLRDSATYRGDFYGLLDSLAVEKKYAYIIMRMNGLTSSDAFDGLTDSILLPSFSEVSEILNIYTSIES